MNQVSFDLLVKNSTYTFLQFFFRKVNPENVKMVISFYEKDNTFIEEHNFVLELDDTRKNHQNSHIGLKYYGMKQKMIYTALNSEYNTPLEKICICVAVVKIKEGNDDKDLVNYLKTSSQKCVF